MVHIGQASLKVERSSECQSWGRNTAEDQHSGLRAGCKLQQGREGDSDHGVSSKAVVWIVDLVLSAEVWWNAHGGC